MPSFAYNCVGVRNQRVIASFDDKKVIQGDFCFENEFGFAMAPVVDGVVVLDEDGAADFPSDTSFLPAGVEEAVHLKFEKLLDNNPSYEVYNPGALAGLLKTHGLGPEA